VLAAPLTHESNVKTLESFTLHTLQAMEGFVSAAPLTHESNVKTLELLTLHTLQAMEGFVMCCPVDARAHLDPLINAGLKLIKFDPNFADEGMDEDEGENEEGCA